MALLVDIEKVLQGFTLKVKLDIGDETLGLLGQSGCGKSMTLKCIAGIETPTKGKIILNGKTLFDSEKGINVPIKNRKVGYLFQNYALFPNMTVLQNIQFGLKDLSEKEREKIAQDKINMFQLNGLENRYPSQLSGGQQQRVAIARALAVDPEILLLDEPFSALDNFLKSQVEKELMDVINSYGRTVIFVSHNMDEVYRICDNIKIISNGREEASGTKKEIFERPPTLISARLTGCKNFSKVKIISDNELEALDWGCRIYTKEKTKENISYIGIRAHHIKIAENNSENNIYRSRIVEFSETPFSTTVYLEIIRDGRKNKFLHWEISKDLWEKLQGNTEELNIIIPDDKIILMRET